MLLADGADGQQHGRPLKSYKAESHILSGFAAASSGNTGGLGASVLRHREGLLKGVGH